MANREHLNLLNQGVEAWNEWRLQNHQIQPDLSAALLDGADLRNADLIRADLSDAYICAANLSRAFLSGANLRNADLSGADLSNALLDGANLRNADLSCADLSNANLPRVNLSRANLSGANLRGANLMYATLIETNCEYTNFAQSNIYGISAWNLKLDEASQSDLIITRENEPTITVDNLEVAQFIYLLLDNKKIREVIDTITSKVVLILGRFGEHMTVLDAIRTELRSHDYLPVLVDFEKPTNRDMTETVRTLAHLARFIIADITEPRSIPQELQAIVPHLKVPIQPLLLEGSTGEYGMFQDFYKYPWVLPVHQYKNVTCLLDSFEENVIAPCEANVKLLQ